MKAYRATITILLDPRVIGPDAQTEWTTDASASDYVSELLSDQQRETVLDWGYQGVERFVVETGFHTFWEEVEVDPDTYEEGEAIIPTCGANP